METALEKLFEFQRFVKNPAMQRVIDEVEVRYASRVLSLDGPDAAAAGGRRSQKHDGRDEPQ